MNLEYISTYCGACTWYLFMELKERFQRIINTLKFYPQARHFSSFSALQEGSWRAAQCPWPHVNRHVTLPHSLKGMISIPGTCNLVRRQLLVMFILSVCVYVWTPWLHVWKKPISTPISPVKKAGKPTGWTDATDLCPHAVIVWK